MERSTYDRPAALVASALGVIAILGTVFFLPNFYCDSPSAQCNSAGPSGKAVLFDVAWGSHDADTRDISLSGTSGGPFTLSSTTTLNSTGTQRGLEVTIPSCTDSADPRLQQPAAQIHITVTGGQANADYTTTCSAKASYILGPFPAPDIVTASGPDAASAQDSVSNDPKLNITTVSYTVTVTVTRAASPSPIPLPIDATLSGTVHVVATTWSPALTPHAKEAQK